MCGVSKLSTPLTYVVGLCCRGGTHLDDEIPDLSRQYALPDRCVQTIEMCVQSSIKDWRVYEMPHACIPRCKASEEFPMVPRSERQQWPTSCVAIPEPSGPRPGHHTTLQPDNLFNRITERLQTFHQFPGWATSDEIDYTLEILRFQEPNTLFCPPAMRVHQSATLSFLNGFQPTYDIVWCIAMQNHWITVELCRYDHFTQLCLTLPRIWRHMVQHLIGVLIRTTDNDQNVLQVHYMKQYDPEGMCGFATLFRLFRRLQLAVGPIGGPQIRILVAHDNRRHPGHHQK